MSDKNILEELIKAGAMALPLQPAYKKFDSDSFLFSAAGVPISFMLDDSFIGEPEVAVSELFRSIKSLGPLGCFLKESSLTPELEALIVAHAGSVILEMAADTEILVNFAKGDLKVDGLCISLTDPLFSSKLKAALELRTSRVISYVGVSAEDYLPILKADLSKLDFVKVASPSILDLEQQKTFRDLLVPCLKKSSLALICEGAVCSSLALSLAEFNSRVAGWLDGRQELVVFNSILSEASPTDQALVKRLQDLLAIAAEFGVDLLGIVRGLPALYVDQATIVACRHTEEFAAEIKAVTAPLPIGLLEELRSRNFVLSDQVFRSDIGPKEIADQRTLAQPLFRVHPSDNVAAALIQLEAGAKITADSMSLNIETKEAIVAGHFFTLVDIAKSQEVICYGQAIGLAKTDLPVGLAITAERLDPLLTIQDEYKDAIGLVSTQGAEQVVVRWSNLERKLPIQVNLSEFKPASEDFAPKNLFPETHFMGFRRPNGRAGVRQQIAIVSQVGCTEPLMDVHLPRLKQELQKRYPHMDLVMVKHGLGCSQTQNATTLLPSLVKNLAENDNVGAILWLGLGCQQLQQENLVQLVKFGKQPAEPVRKVPEAWLVSQNLENDYRALLKAMLGLAEEIGGQERELIEIADLIFFTECGGSDALSGVTANPLVGASVRHLAAKGATVMIGETTELPDDIFLNWCINEKVATKCLEAKILYNRYLAQFGGDERFNPVKGNKDGGLSTSLHKALGAAQKIANIPIKECISYGSRATPRLGGACFVDSTSADSRSVTAKVIAGANLGVFTSGRMTPWGSSIAPTLKIGTNSPRARTKADWNDFDAGRMISEGATIDDLSREFFLQILRTASGALTQAELNNSVGSELWLPGTGFQ